MTNQIIIPKVRNCQYAGCDCKVQNHHYFCDKHWGLRKKMVLESIRSDRIKRYGQAPVTILNKLKEVKA